ncbi:MAG: hypothetical protein IKS61_00115 [Aeriscardovia sp.]|nr:hypothetical protein [Aeriscardovia sp.]
MGTFNVVSRGEFSTVLANKDELKRLPKNRDYQYERDLEGEFVRSLCSLGYEEYKGLHTEKGLEANLREQIEKLNGYHFSDADWDGFCNEKLSNLDREKSHLDYPGKQHLRLYGRKGRAPQHKAHRQGRPIPQFLPGRPPVHRPGRYGKTEK